MRPDVEHRRGPEQSRCIDTCMCWRIANTTLGRRYVVSPRRLSAAFTSFRVGAAVAKRSLASRSARVDRFGSSLYVYAMYMY